MTYEEWISLHVKAKQKILKKLSGLNDEKIIEYFVYENMKKRERLLSFVC